MKRDLEQQLIAWKEHPLRKPLILRGALQVGKTWLIDNFSAHFDNFISLNFDLSPSLKQLFEGDLHIPALLDRVALYAQQKIIPGKTLLFLDEIQECPNALRALRYFKEQTPELHVIAAGSLIDFTLEKIGMPVGRVQFMYLYPLSFGEFLSALGHNTLRDSLLQGHCDELVYPTLMDQVKAYLWIGGMPAVTKAWRDHRDVTLCQELQDEILLAYRDDFEKYARKNQIEKVEKVFASIPNQLGGKFKYTHVDPLLRANVLRSALNLLEKAGVAHIVYHSTAQNLPLAATRNDRLFKVFFLDIGLVQRFLGLDIQDFITSDLEVSYRGALIEQFVAQEYIAYTSQKKPHQLHYWAIEGGKSNAEVDFVFLRNHDIIPVEVKSGPKGRLRSLQAFLEGHPNVSSALKISEAYYHQLDEIEGIPLFGIESWLKN